MNASKIRKTILASAALAVVALASCTNPTSGRLVSEPDTGIDTDSASGLIAGLDLEGEGIMENNDAVVSGTVTWEEGLSGNAMRGDEDGDYLRILDGTLPETPYTGSVEVWIYPEHSDKNNYFAGILHKGDEIDFSDEAWSLQNWQSERMAFLYSPASDPDTYQKVLADTYLAVDAWNHVAVTWECDEASGDVILKLYINGELDKTATFSALGPMYDSDGDLLVGSQLPEQYDATYGHLSFRGLIDEISVYDTVRTAEEIQADYEVYFPTE